MKLKLGKQKILNEKKESKTIKTFLRAKNKGVYKMY